MTHQVSSIFSICWYMLSMHKVSIVLYIFHDPVWLLTEYYRPCSAISLHEVLLTDHLIAMQYNVLLCNIFTVFCAKLFLYWTWYSFSVHFFWLVCFPYLTWSITPFEHVGSERCFVIPLQDLCCLFVFRCALTYVCYSQ